MKVLLIEDNSSIIKGLTYSFQQNNYQIIAVKTLCEARCYLEKHTDISLIILDIILPDGNGFYFYKEAILDKKIPTIFLTAKDEEDEIVKGLTMGAEDYVTKPFSTKELLARVNKISSRAQKNSLIKIKDICFDMDKMSITKNDRIIEFTALELNILYLLFLNRNKVVSRGMILDKIWEVTGNDVDDHTVTVYLKRIREKLGSDIITTIKGMGYRIDDER